MASIVPGFTTLAASPKQRYAAVRLRAAGARGYQERQRGQRGVVGSVRGDVHQGSALAFFHDLELAPIGSTSACKRGDGLLDHSGSL
jgi:hypothetical protein